MKRKMIDITRLVRPSEQSLRCYILGFTRVSDNYIDKLDLILNYSRRMHVIRSDELPPEILLVRDMDNTFWHGAIEQNNGKFDIRSALADYSSIYGACRLGVADRVQTFCIEDGEADYSDNSVIVRQSCRGTYYLGHSAYDNNHEIHITKYISYEGNHNTHIRKTLKTLFKGKDFTNEDFCQLLLNKRKRRPFGDEEYYYTRCTLYTNKFIYDCRNGDIVITVNDNRYLITSYDMAFNDLYVLRLLIAASAGNLEEVIIDKYSSVWVHMLKENFTRQ